MAKLQQSIKLSLEQKLSPQQMQLMKLLQVPAIAMEQRIKQEIEENPALEEFEEDENETNNEEEDFQDDINEGEESDYEENIENDFNIDDYIDTDETPEYKLNINNRSKDEEDKQVPFVSQASFYDSLEEQFHMKQLTEKQRIIGDFIICTLDENGYLHREPAAIANDLAFTQNISANNDEIKDVIAIIQQLDPPGIGAENLQECLLLQLKRKELQSQAIASAIRIIETTFEEFTKKHYDKILKRLFISENDLKAAIDEIVTLNPKPGSTYGETSKGSVHIFPDFTIVNNENELELIINSKSIPELRINKTYSEMLESYAKSGKQDSKTKETIQFFKQKIDSARWFIDAIKQRQNTLFVTMSAIMNYQKEYFLTGDETTIRPMILKDIADIVKLDISTISRVTSQKYVQTSFGTFLLKKFFSESMSTESGEEVSSREVKSILTELIDTENKKQPLADEMLAKKLKEKGYNIARRTIAKYREQLNIPVARLRKEL